VSEPGHFAPSASWTQLPDDPMAESGRGGFLISESFDELRHLNSGGRHTLRLRRRLGLPTPKPNESELEQTLGAMTEDLSASYETLSALFKLAEALATSEDLTAFATHALHLQVLIDADFMVVRLRDKNGNLTLLGSIGDIAAPAVLPVSARTVEADVFQSGTERTVADAESLGADDPLRAMGSIAFVCPVYFQSRQLGVCVVGRRNGGAYFTAAQISLARTTAEFLGIACANAESQAQRLAQLRVQRELEIAAQIQQSLVPRDFPHRTDWALHGQCVNALEAGGDFYDIVEVTDGVLLVIADVMGKGLPAALLAVVLRTAVRAHTSLARDPGEMLNCVSVQIAPDLERLGMFITAQLVFLEAGTANVAYANAGHCAIVVIAQEGREARTLEEGGLPLGVSQREHYTAHRASLRTGERLLLVTDGILEAPDTQGRELGLDGFVLAARRLHDVRLDQLCPRLLSIVDERDPSGSPSDDRTLLAVQSVS
jgi:serine phosphatase RsbU (regulator of sigma subunit)